MRRKILKAVYGIEYWDVSDTWLWRIFYPVAYCPDPDCHKLERVLWWRVGNHSDCVPF